MIGKTIIDRNSSLESENVFSIENIKDKDIDGIVDMCVDLFSEATGTPYFPEFFLFMSDFSISKKAVLNGKIIGVYLLNEEHICSYTMNRKENLDAYKDKYCLQGVALGILKEYRGQSYGRQLRDSVLGMDDYDCIWGFQLKTLNNLDNWLNSGRRLVGEIEKSYVTLKDF